MTKMCELKTSLPIEDFEGLMRQSFGSDLEIKHVTWKHLTDPGENFGSLIVAVTVNFIENFSSNTMNLVVKLPPESPHLLDLFNCPLTFKKELKFYSDVVPVFADIYRSLNVKNEFFVPRFIGGRLGLKNPDKFDSQAAIILENLKLSGYTVEDRIMGMDLDHIKFGVQKLAEFHAMTIGLRIKRRDFFENTVLPTLIPPANEAAMKGVMDMINKAHETLKRIEEAKPYLESIEATLKSNNMDNVINKEDLWATIVHNDFWVNNMLFRHDASGNIIDLKMVDFQLCIYSYGIEDLIFFLLSSSNKEVLDNNLDDMIDLYYDTFIDVLKKLKINTEHYSKSKFLELLNKHAHSKFSQCIFMVQVIQATRISRSELKNNDNNVDLSKIESNNIGNQKLLHIVKIFAKKNWLLK
ncbi:PREDICTED: uncharacterized protein LOC107074598 isoform X2 [Polistes dominula]|uniref:Uncharacterized protein LOC107074598 isoform X2 n=1 Tax=Polistes dominula TaxID=743375 RepID=A0ABM1JGR2_POLDO|nr:PREDICTED: uncharacterized protein LOC107074598 isoform X2 [Polistes dominula]